MESQLYEEKTTTKKQRQQIFEIRADWQIKTDNKLRKKNDLNTNKIWNSLYIYRVRVTDHHCRHLRRKIKFGTKNHKLVKTSGEKNITWITR